MRFSTLAFSLLAGSAAAKRSCPPPKIHTEYKTFTVTGVPAAPSTSIKETTSSSSETVVFPTSIVPSDTPIENPVKPTTTETPTVEPTTSSTAAPQPTGGNNGGLTADQQAALDAHNSARADVGVPPLTWDAELEASALAWAKELVPLGGTLKHSGPGENLAWKMQTGGNFENPLSMGTKMWLDEKSMYDGRPIDTSTPEAEEYFKSIGHYTQCVWNTTTKVGIAALEQGEDVWIVAHYDPAGNYGGQVPY